MKYKAVWLTLYLLMALTLLGCQASRPTPTSATWHWQQANGGLLQQAIVLTVAADPIDPNHLWAGYYGTGTLASSHDGGQSWSTGAEDLVDNPVFDLLPLVSVKGEAADVVLWAATRKGMRHSFDRGESWHITLGNLPSATVFALAADANGRLYVGLEGAGVYRQTDDPQKWEAIATDKTLASATVISVAVSADGQYIYAGTSGQGLYASADGGQSWQQTYSESYVPVVSFNPTQPQHAVATLRDRLVRSQDGGQSWHTVLRSPDYNVFVSLLWLADGNLGAGASQGYLYRSQDGGDTWLQGGEGLPPGGVLSLAVVGGQQLNASTQLLVGTWTGIYASDDGGQTLSLLTPTIGSPFPQTLLATETGLFLGTRSGLFRWQPDSQQWAATATGLPVGVTALAANPHNQQIMYAGTTGEGVYRSQDAGASWQPLPSLQKEIPALAVAPTNPDHIYMLAAWERVYASLDGGQNWEARWEGMGEIIETITLAVDPQDSMVYVGTESGLYRSGYNGVWDLGSPMLQSQSVLALLVQTAPNWVDVDTMLYIGTTQGAYRSVDQGQSIDTDTAWGRGLENLSVTAFLADPKRPLHLYAGTAYNGVYHSVDGGQSWQAIGPANLSGDVVESMAWGPEEALFIVTTDNVWRGQQQ